MPAGRRVRVAIVGASPCGACAANCCKQNGHEFAVLLRGDEVRRFAAFSTHVRIERAPGDLVTERVLPYADGRCQFLGPDDRCTIYEDRPASCREFECARYFNAGGVGRHGRFLELNPDVRARLESW
jgi:Fe-S-cluster containining protein